MATSGGCYSDTSEQAHRLSAWQGTGPRRPRTPPCVASAPAGTRASCRPSTRSSLGEPSRGLAAAFYSAQRRSRVHSDACGPRCSVTPAVPASSACEKCAQGPRANPSPAEEPRRCSKTSRDTGMCLSRRRRPLPWRGRRRMGECPLFSLSLSVGGGWSGHDEQHCPRRRTACVSGALPRLGVCPAHLGVPKGPH